MNIDWYTPIDNWLASVVNRWYFLELLPVFSGRVSLIMSNSTPNVDGFLVFVLLPLDEVLADERLVLDEKDDPSDIIEFGRCTSFVLSDTIEQNELRSLGAKTKKKIIFFNMFRLNLMGTWVCLHTFFQLWKTHGTIIDLILTRTDIQTGLISNAHRWHFSHSNISISFRLFP